MTLVHRRETTNWIQMSQEYYCTLSAVLCCFRFFSFALSSHRHYSTCFSSYFHVVLSPLPLSFRPLRPTLSASFFALALFLSIALPFCFIRFFFLQSCSLVSSSFSSRLVRSSFLLAFLIRSLFLLLRFIIRFWRLMSDICFWPSIISICFWTAAVFIAAFEVCNDHHSHRIPRSLFLAHYLSLGVAVFSAMSAVFSLVHMGFPVSSAISSIFLGLSELCVTVADQYCLIPVLLMTLYAQIRTVSTTIRFRLHPVTKLGFLLSWLVFILIFSILPWSLCFSFNQRHYHYLFYVGHTLFAFVTGVVVVIYCVILYRAVHGVVNFNEEIAIRNRWKSFTRFATAFGIVLFLCAIPPVFAAIADWTQPVDLPCLGETPEEACNFFPFVIFAARFILCLFAMWSQWRQRSQRSILKVSSINSSANISTASMLNTYSVKQGSASPTNATGSGSPALSATLTPPSLPCLSPRALFKEKHKVSFPDNDWLCFLASSFSQSAISSIFACGWSLVSCFAYVVCVI